MPDHELSADELAAEALANMRRQVKLTIERHGTVVGLNYVDVAVLLDAYDALLIERDRLRAAPRGVLHCEEHGCTSCYRLATDALAAAPTEPEHA